MGSNFTKIVAIINIGLFIFLSYRVYQQHKIFAEYEASKSQSVFQQKDSSDSSPTPEVAELLNTIATDADVSNRFKAIQQLPREADESLLENLLALIEAENTWSGLAPIDRFDVKDGLFKYMARKANAVLPLIEHLFATVSDSDQLLVERQQAFRYLFISLGQVTKTYAEANTLPELKPFSQKLYSLLLDTISETDNTLSLMSLEGMDYLKKENPEAWPFPQLEGTILNYLKTDNLLNETHLTALKMAKQWKFQKTYPELKRIALSDAQENLKIEALKAAYAMNPEMTLAWVSEINVRSSNLQIAILEIQKNDS